MEGRGTSRVARKETMCVLCYHFICYAMLSKLASLLIRNHSVAGEKLEKQSRGYLHRNSQSVIHPSLPPST